MRPKWKKSDYHAGQPKNRRHSQYNRRSQKTSTYKRPKNHSRKTNKESKHVENKQNRFETLLPKDTLDLIHPSQIDNFFLKLNKAVKFEINKNFSKRNFVFFKKDRDNIKLKFNVKFSEEFVQNIARRHHNLIKKLGLELYTQELSPEWRMVIGLGDSSVYETSITLHHIYGIPYIPGSAIKGVFRNYIIYTYFGKKGNELDLANAEKRAFQDQGFCDIFGAPKESFYKAAVQGKVIFFDAYPQGKIRISPDVMNPHYAPYYNSSDESDPPGDYYNPIPIYFLTVYDTSFEFLIGVHHDDNKPIKSGKFEGKMLSEVISKNFENAIRDFGIGAKTAVGYGHMIF